MHSQILKKGIKNEYWSITSLKDYDEILNEIECKVNDKNMIYIYYKDIKDLVIYCKGKNTYNRSFRKNEFIKREINIKKIRII